MGRCQAGGSGIEIVGDGLVELVFWNRIGLGEIEGTARSVVESLIQEEVTLRRAPGRGDGWRAVGEVEVEQDPLNVGGIGEAGQDPHVWAEAMARAAAESDPREVDQRRLEDVWRDLWGDVRAVLRDARWEDLSAFVDGG